MAGLNEDWKLYRWFRGLTFAALAVGVVVMIVRAIID
jgi:hypothetical protein